MEEWRSGVGGSGCGGEAGHLVRPAVLGGEELLQAREGGDGRGGDGQVGQVPGEDDGEGLGEGDEEERGGKRRKEERLG